VRLFLFSSLEEQPSIVSLFESTIRYIGGLLSAYELRGKQHRSLVTQAAQLADKLIYAWVGVRSYFYFISYANGNVQKNDIPFGQLNFNDNIPVNQNVSRSFSLLLFST